MAARVYSLRIFAHASLVSSGGKVGPVVPTGMIYILRDVDLWESTGGSAAMVIWSGALGVLGQFVSPPSSAPSRNIQWSGRQVYEEGEQVGFQVQSGTWAITASGYQLSLP